MGSIEMGSPSGTLGDYHTTPTPRKDFPSMQNITFKGSVKFVSQIELGSHTGRQAHARRAMAWLSFNRVMFR